MFDRSFHTTISKWQLASYQLESKLKQIIVLMPDLVEEMYGFWQAEKGQSVSDDDIQSMAAQMASNQSAPSEKVAKADAPQKPAAAPAKAAPAPAPKQDAMTIPDDEPTGGTGTGPAVAVDDAAAPVEVAAAVLLA